MRKKFLILSCSFAFCVLSFTFSSYAQESITITTYYPSPFGSYNQLQASSFGVGDNDNDNDVDSDDVPTTRGDIWVEGNVGIGTISPGAKLEVSQDANSAWRLGEHPSYVNYSALWNSGRGNVAGSYVLLADNANTFLNAFGAGNLYFREDNNNLMTILNGGNVGIGTASPARRLEVNGAAQSTDFYLSDGVQIQGLSGRNYFRDTEAAGNLRVGAAWGMPGIYAESGVGVVGGAGGTSLQNNSLFVTPAGRVGIGTTSPAVRLDLNGGKMHGQLDCRIVISGWAINSTTASCAANEYVVGGGGECENGSFGYLHASFPLSLTSWFSDCYRHDGVGDINNRTRAICCRKS